MTRFTLTAFCVLAVLASTTTAPARELFRILQAEELAPPTRNLVAPPVTTTYQPPQRMRYIPAQKMPYQASQKMPYQALQKMPYQALQKGVHQKGHVATHVRYVQHCRLKRTCCGCKTSFQTTVAVYDPCNCCMIDVPICLPGCCTGAPMSGGRGGLFGQGINNFVWSCGYKVRVVVSKHGDVVVHYYGS